MTNPIPDAKTSVKVTADRHLYAYLKEKLADALAAECRLEMHVHRPDAPDISEYRPREGDGPPLFLEVTQENYDSFVIRLKGGRPGVARRIALGALRAAMVGLADAFAIDVARDRAMAKRDEFVKAVDKIVGDLTDGR